MKVVMLSDLSTGRIHKANYRDSGGNIKNISNNKLQMKTNTNKKKKKSQVLYCERKNEKVTSS
jgi:transcription elongation factor